MGHPLTGGIKSGSGDTGYWGSGKTGIYLSRTLNYAAKYSNPQWLPPHGYVPTPLSPETEVVVIAFRFCPGEEFKPPAVVGAQLQVQPGYDSHMSGEGHEWWLPYAGQCVPRFLVHLKAKPKTDG